MRQFRFRMGVYQVSSFVGNPVRCRKELCTISQDTILIDPLTPFLLGRGQFDPPVVFFTQLKKYWSEAVEIF